MNDTLLSAYAIGYLLAVALLIFGMYKATLRFSAAARLPIYAFIYALCFGIGFIMTDVNAAPGFAFPAPIGAALLMFVLEGYEFGSPFTINIISLFFWWAMIILAMQGMAKPKNI